MFDKIDKEILRFLSKKPRATIRELSKNIGVTRNTIRKHILDFCKKNIKIEIAFPLKLLNPVYFSIFLSVKDIDIKFNLLSYLIKCPRIIFLLSYIGNFDIAFVIFGRNINEIEVILKNILYSPKIIRKYALMFSENFLKVPNTLNISKIMKNLELGYDCFNCIFNGFDNSNKCLLEKMKV